MNTIHASNGLSARQRSIHKIKNFFSAISRAFKRSTLLSIVLGVFIFSSCQEKTNGQASIDNKPTGAVIDSTNKPKVSIKVNRRYDEKGKLIGFDSTYSSYYSNIQGDTVGMDTLFNQFGRFFNRNHTSIMNDEFNTLFFEDSLRYPDFFHNDFFLRRYELNDAYMRQMMKRMDSVKNDFYKDQSKRTKEAEKK